ELSQRLLQRRARERIDVPQRAEHEQAALGELAREKLKEKERRRVGGMEIVEREEKRAGPRCVAEELGGRVEEPEARALGVERRRLRQLPEALPQLRDDLRDVSRARAELPTQLVALAFPNVPTQRLHPRPIRGRAAGLPAAADAHREPTRPRRASELFAEPALAAARPPAPAARRAAARERGGRAGSA